MRTVQELEELLGRSLDDTQGNRHYQFERTDGLGHSGAVVESGEIHSTVDRLLEYLFRRTDSEIIQEVAALERIDEDSDLTAGSAMGSAGPGGNRFHLASVFLGSLGNPAADLVSPHTRRLQPYELARLMRAFVAKRRKAESLRSRLALMSPEARRRVLESFASDAAVSCAYEGLEMDFSELPARISK